jgi:cytochrome P450
LNAQDVDPAIVTPVRGPGKVAGQLQGPAIAGFAARFGAWAARRSGKPFRIGKRVVAARHADVRSLLHRDLDFIIAPVNEAKIGEVNGGPFILGMDRSPPLERERRALYSAMKEVDYDRLRDETEADIDAILSRVSAGAELDIVGSFARPVAARTARRLFGLGNAPERGVMEAARSVFAHTFLNLGNDAKIRERGIAAGRAMQAWYGEEIERRRASGELGDDLMGALLRQDLLDDAAVRRTLGGMLVGSVDTTASCVAKIIKTVSRDPDLEHSIRRDVHYPDRMHGWCNEALRRWPHNPIVLRTAAADCSLAGTPVRAGETVIAWTQAAMLDGSVFEDPRRLRPDRDEAAYLHLGGGLHPCSGRPVNRFQIPLLVGGLVARGLERVGKIGWAGPFPHRLPVTLREGPH